MGSERLCACKARPTSPAAGIKKGSSTANFNECSHPSEKCFAAMKSCFDLRDGEELFVRCLGSRLGLESGITKLLLCFQQTTLSLLILVCITPQEALARARKPLQL